MAAEPKRESDPLWYKDAIIYQVHVRSFRDSDGDGMGDFRGLTEKLGYLESLGVTAIWLLPFYPSPWRDDGYDIADYTRVHEAYGDLKDFKAFLREAHRRDLKVITELVINHTSEQHPWFQRARRAPAGSRLRDFYVWSDSPERYQEARIIFKDFEASNWTWDPVAKAYYWHRFYAHQPDLNFANEAVHKAIFQALDFWLEMGVDGLRLDAIPYLYEREETNCENLPETHAFLKKLRAHVEASFPGRMLLAEANQWPEDAIAYFGDGDECHMAFHFPVMPRLYMAVRREERYPVVEIMEQTPPIPETCQWAVFLRNHDELTLEMVTDEERDYMWQVYARDPRARINLGIRRRLAPLMGNDRRRMELMNGLLFSLPGSPIIYYGDEIGMGDNIYLGDRNGVRTPMQWSPDRNAGFSRANPQKLFFPVVVDPEHHYEAVNVELQEGNPHSLLWWTRRLIALRKRYRALSRGTLELLHPDNPKVLAFLRRFEGEAVLVVANLSRFSQHVALDLSAFRGTTPVEAFGRTRFPAIRKAPYPLTLGPHNFFWFALESAPDGYEQRRRSPENAAPVLALTGSWESAFEGPGRAALEAALPGILHGRRWFGGKARSVRAVRLVESIPLRNGAAAPGAGGREARLALVAVDYAEGEGETYALPLAFSPAGEELPAAAVVARLEGPGGLPAGVLYDALWDPAFARGLLEAIARRRRFRENGRELAAWPGAALRDILPAGGSVPEPEVVRAEQSNTSVVFGDRFILKLFRRLEPGINPDLEIGRFLTEEAGFPHTPRVAGGLEIRRQGGEPLTLGILQEYVPNEGDAWSYSLSALGRFFDRALTHEGGDGAWPARGWVPRARLLDLAGTELPAAAYDVLGTYLESARLLGRRTAELHLALASGTTAGFVPEPYSTLYQRSLYQSMRSLAQRTFRLLRTGLPSLPADVRPAAEAVLGAQDRVVERFAALLEGKVEGARIRTHGDYHLGQVLYTGRDFVIIDFEGEPARPLSERRLKRSPLRDVAGMLRSFHYATWAALFQAISAGAVPETQRGVAGEAALAWHRWVSAAFLREYLLVAAAGRAVFLPAVRSELELLLDVFLLEKAVYEVAYELNNRPDWLAIPLAGIRDLLGLEELDERAL